MGKVKSKQPIDLAVEIRDVKKLLILNLLHKGLTQSQIGQALDIDQSQISRMIPASALKSKKPRG